MTGLPTLTLQAPYGSLIARGPKTIETRSWSTRYRGRIGIHQGKTWAPGWRGWLDADDWRLNTLDGIGADINEDVNRSGFCRVDPYTLPLGALVATAELVDAVPVENLIHESTAPAAEPWGHEHYIVDLDRQHPLGDFSAGRWAWLLDDIRRTTERCPACWGDGLRRAFTDSDQPSRWGGTTHPCPVCDGAGRCQPIATRGRQGLWRFAAVPAGGEAATDG